MSKSILVIGANRGIGLNLLKVFTERQWNVTGTVRPRTLKDQDPSIKDLQATGAKILELDFVDEDSIVAAAKAFGDGPLDILINCAGVPAPPEDSFQQTGALITERLQIMAVGPFLTTKHFLPNLKKSSAGKIINISSDFGSLSDNKKIGEGHFLAYRMAKAALNQQTITISNELRNDGFPISVISLNPGYVATRLTEWRSKNDMATSIKGMVDVIDKVGPEESGLFLNWDGIAFDY